MGGLSHVCRVAGVSGSIKRLRIERMVAFNEIICYGEERKRQRSSLPI